MNVMFTMATTKTTATNDTATDNSAAACSKAEFETAFGPLAHHFYPDGCPETDLLSTSVWPVAQDRTPIAPADALAAMSLLQTNAHRKGFTTPQLAAIAVIACATLPSCSSSSLKKSNNNSNNNNNGSVGVGAGSPLVDGSSRHFQSLVQCLIPAAINSDSIPASVVGMLLSIVTSKMTNDNDNDDALVSTVLRFFTLGVRRTGALDTQARGRLDSLYNVIFFNCLFVTPTTTVTSDTATSATATTSPSSLSLSASAATRITDAVRLLLALTQKRHVRGDRIRKLRACLEMMTTTTTTTAATTATTATHNLHRRVHNALTALLQLYSRYNVVDDNNSNNNNNSNSNNSNSNGRLFGPFSVRNEINLTSYHWFAFPDPDWALAFAGQHGTATTTTAVQTGTHRHRHRPAKRSRLDPKELLMDESKNTSAGSAVDLLMDADMRHALVLSNHQNHNDGAVSAEVTEAMMRLRACLPYILHDEWYQYQQPNHRESHNGSSGNTRDQYARLDRNDDNNDHNDDPMEEDTTKTTETFATGNTSMSLSATDSYSSRLRLLEALADFATHTDSLPLEAERFVLQDIAPLWDGTDETSQLLCYDILPALQPCTFSHLRSLLLRHLERLFSYGSARIQYAIVAGTLASLVNRWGRLDWSVASHLTSLNSDSISTEDDANAMKIQTLRELIHWTDDLILKGFLVDGGGHELLRAAAIDFFAAVCDLTDHCTFLAAPSPSITYRLLLSKSALHLDRVCHLLVKYKATFQKLKQRQEQEARADDAVSGLDRVKIFNCFVWDFCSVLWRCSPPPNPHVTGQESTLSILYTDLRPETQSQLYAAADKVASTLSITHSAVFAGYASEFLKSQQLPNQQQNPSPDLIRGKLKVKYLDYLKTCGMEGIHSFLSSFVGSLANRSSRRLRRQQQDQQQQDN
jgi:hypothetical protein